MPDKRILLVEDDDDVRFILAALLERDGYVVDAAGEFSEAMGLLEARPYRLAIVDWVIPGGDGLTIADAAADKGSKTILISGFLFRIPADRIKRHDGTLMKPVRTSDLIDAVTRAIGSPAEPSAN